MPRNMTNEVLVEAQKVVDVWAANPDFVLGAVKPADFQNAIAVLTAADAAVEKLRTELAGLINDRDAKLANLNDLVTRAKSGIRATYGPDSTQYEQAGCKRKSERKAPIRKPKPTA